MQGNVQALVRPVKAVKHNTRFRSEVCGHIAFTLLQEPVVRRILERVDQIRILVESRVFSERGELDMYYT